MMYDMGYDSEEDDVERRSKLYRDKAARKQKRADELARCQLPQPTRVHRLQRDAAEHRAEQDAEEDD